MWLAVHDRVSLHKKVTEAGTQTAELAVILTSCLLGRRQANLCFHFAGSEENLPDIAKPRNASMGRKQNSFLF